MRLREVSLQLLELRRRERRADSALFALLRRDVRRVVMTVARLVHVVRQTCSIKQ